MSLALFAQGILATDSWPPPLEDSKAFQQFSGRPYSELSKIIYLIDRFGDHKIEVLYDGHYYSAGFVKQVARWFLFHHYRKETAEQWILRWCNKTVPSGNLIWVKLPDSSLKLAREILLQELEFLEKRHTQKNQPQEETLAAVAPAPEKKESSNEPSSKP